MHSFEYAQVVFRVSPGMYTHKGGFTMLIALNPGHFPGLDPGAVSANGVEEATVVRAVTGELQRLLEKEAINCLLIESNELAEIAEEANSSGADLFISLHANAAENPQANGCETYCYPGSKSGADLAAQIQSSLAVNMLLADRGVKEAAFYVLRYTAMPAVLCELAFLSNPYEAELLTNEGWQKTAAAALCDGITAYATL